MDHYIVHLKLIQHSILITLQLKKSFLKTCPEDIQNAPQDFCEFSGPLLVLDALHHNDASFCQCILLSSIYTHIIHEDSRFYYQNAGERNHIIFKPCNLNCILGISIYNYIIYISIYIYIYLSNTRNFYFWKWQNNSFGSIHPLRTNRLSEQNLKKK